MEVCCWCHPWTMATYLSIANAGLSFSNICSFELEKIFKTPTKCTKGCTKKGASFVSQFCLLDLSSACMTKQATTVQLHLQRTSSHLDRPFLAISILAEYHPKISSLDAWPPFTIYNSFCHHDDKSRHSTHKVTPLYNGFS